MSGGEFCSNYPNMLRASDRNYAAPTEENVYGDKGFRVAYVPEPASSTLLLAGAACLLALASRR
jgi:hypothetical protein